jgi:hypothetical protein
MPKERYVRASEIGSYVFCRRAWHLDQRSVPTTLEPERAAGVVFHQQHGQLVQRSVQLDRLATLITLFGLLLTAFAIWLWSR